jgi:hypothetical protein
MLYELLARGMIRSFALKKRGAVRGIRLIDKHSLDEFFEAKAKAAEASAAPKTEEYAEEEVSEI